MDKKYKITGKVKKSLEMEHNYLKTTRTREVEAMIAEALMFGDPENNSEYDAAMCEQQRLHGRIREIEDILACAAVNEEEEEKQLSEAFLSELSKQIQACGLSPEQADSYAQYCKLRYEMEEEEQYGVLPAEACLKTLKEAQRILSGNPKASKLDNYKIDRFLQIPCDQWESAKNAVTECFGCTPEAVDTFYNEDTECLLLTAEKVCETAEYLKQTLCDAELSWKIFRRGAVFCSAETFRSRIDAIITMLGAEVALNVIRTDAEARGWIFWGYYSDPVECIAYMKECGLAPEKILTVIQQEPDLLYLYKKGRKLSYCHDQEYIDRILRRYTY